MDRAEAVALVKELGDKELIKPTFLILQGIAPDRYIVKMKGDFYWKEIECFLTGRGYVFEQNNDFLIISNSEKFCTAGW